MCNPRFFSRSPFICTLAIRMHLKTVNVSNYTRAQITIFFCGHYVGNNVRRKEQRATRHGEAKGYAMEFVLLVKMPARPTDHEPGRCVYTYMSIPNIIPVSSTAPRVQHTIRRSKNLHNSTNCPRKTQ